ncbi:MAG: hypothetical protein QF570_05290 [Myxococcota bacterium]|jgi:hypothetical protein|nr:hypothetical protein [Myxococcota bacterium]
MSEATMDPSEVAALEQAAREFDRSRMKQIGSYHFAMVFGALTLWGAAQTWAQVTGSSLAQIVAVANAFVAAYVISSTVHEWGHFTGARMSGAVSPVLEEPRRHFFMFDFAMDQNDLRQFTWMSWGGILAPWVAVLLALIFVPLGTLSGAVLVSALIAKSVAAGVFEVPIVNAAGASGDPGGELGKATMGGALPRAARKGKIVGLVVFVLIWLIA